MLKMRHKNLLLFAAIAIVTAAVGTFVYLYEIPPLIYHGWERGLLKKGLGGGPIPVNTLFAEPGLMNPDSAKSNRLVAGADPGLLYTVGVLDLTSGPEIFRVPAMAGRYYDIELVDSRGDDFAYLGSRTTGGRAGSFLISGPGWRGTVPNGVRHIKSPDDTVLLLGRVLPKSRGDVSAAYELSKRARLTPLSRWKPAAG